MCCVMQCRVEILKIEDDGQNDTYLQATPRHILNGAHYMTPKLSPKLWRW